MCTLLSDSALCHNYDAGDKGNVETVYSVTGLSIITSETTTSFVSCFIDHIHPRWELTPFKGHGEHDRVKNFSPLVEDPALFPSVKPQACHMPA